LIPRSTGAGIHHDKLTLTVAFPVGIDLAAINRRR